MPKTNSIPTLTLLLTIACGPPRAGVDTTDGGSTGEQGTDSSTDVETESSSTSETDDPSTSESSDDAVFFPNKEDMPIVPCDPFMQDCPEGEKCVPYASSGGGFDANKCVPVLGEQGTGEPCTYDGAQASTDDCDANNYCWNVHEIDGEPVGVCTPFCLGSADAPECPPDSACSISGDGGVNLCVFSCDPLVQDCNEGLGCYWIGGDFSCVPPIDDIPVGEPCGFINDCAKGLGCLTAEVLPDCGGSACCSGFCNLQLGDGPCEALLPGTSCQSFFEEGTAPPGHEDLGVCILSP